MKLAKLLIIISICILVIPSIFAKTNHMSLLTVSDNGVGGIADIYLETRPGSGNIFIDSYPLTKLDTQISTRYANEVACDFLEIDCSQYDFFYTIRAKASVVGGPSAGAAMTILTISSLSNLELDEKAVMTGTINSGGLIGPVAGIDAKVSAALNKGFTKVIIPKWQSTINLSNINKDNLDEKIQIIKVKNLEEALFHFTGKKPSSKKNEIIILKDYKEIMKDVAKTLCNRSDNIIKNIGEVENNNSLKLLADNFLNRSIEADIREDYYSKASFCFSANIRLRNLEYSTKEEDELKEIFKNLKEELIEVKKSLPKDLNTLQELETYMIVQERLSEAEIVIDDIQENLENKTYNLSFSSLAYAKERLYSGVAWSEFFKMNGKELSLDETYLEEACTKKLAEADERINYAELYLPGFLSGAKEELEQAMSVRDQEKYALCIFKASKAKAEGNMIISAISISEEDLNATIKEQLNAIKDIIVKQQQKGFFPIMGYSYYEYSKSLLIHEPSSSLTFAEYALELSRLDMYFPTKKSFSIRVYFDQIKIFIMGFVVGASIILLINIFRRKERDKKSNKKINKKKSSNNKNNRKNNRKKK